MTFYYQLILLGNLGQRSREIEKLFFEKIKELSLPKDFFLVLDENNFHSVYKENQPAFAIYLGDVSSNFKNADIVSTLISDATAILPVYENSFDQEIPEELKIYNAEQYDQSKDSKIVNLALESFGKLRHTRKVFISYKRDESSSIAIQLYEALERNNFDVFLDTHSIKKGEIFQDELWHRMADCDVIVLLNTPKFLTSEWCKEEIAEASVKQIGIVQLVWPNHRLEKEAELTLPIFLNDYHFENNLFDDKTKSRFVQTMVDNIVSKVESMRARNLAARQDNLITEFTNLALKNGKKVVLQPARFLTEDIEENTRRIFIPTIGVPQSIDCNQSEDLIKEFYEDGVDSIYLLFDDLRLREKWLKHLDWLNKHLKVKTLKKQNFEKWLKKH